MNLLINLLVAFLVFFIVRYIGTMVAPEGQDKDKIVTIVALICAVLVYLSGPAASIHG